MDIKRRLALGAATLSVALGAGQLVQSGYEANPPQRQAALSSTLNAITPLSASAEPDVTLTGPSVAGPVAPSAAILVSPPGPVTVAATDPVAAPLPISPPTTATTAPAVDNCAVSLDVSAASKSSLDILLRAPCEPDTRIVLRHGGLAVTARTSATGALFVSLPALDAAGDVSVLLPDGTSASASAPVSLSDVRRVAVQWLGNDTFQLHAFENGAAFGTPGHVHAATPVGRGLLSRLGDGSVDLPMLAEVYTFPAGTLPVDIQIEAATSTATCGREILGEAIDSHGGDVTRLDLTMAMPGCDAIGDILVLNNPFAGTTLASAE